MGYHLPESLWRLPRSLEERWNMRLVLWGDHALSRRGGSEWVAKNLPGEEEP